MSFGFGSSLILNELLGWCLIDFEWIFELVLILKIWKF